MLFKDLRRSIKQDFSEPQPRRQQQQSASKDIQRLIDDAAIANKRSRLQVFELRPTRSGKFWRK